MWIVRLALRRPYTFVVVALMVLILGIAAIISMPKDILPNVDIPVVSVIWQYNGLAPDDMQKRIVTPSERALSQTVNDVEHIEGQSFYGVAAIKLFFQPGADVNAAQAQVEASTAAITRILPAGITPPLVIRYSASNVPILQASIGSDTIPEQGLFDYATNFIRTGLITVQGAQLPLPYGGKSRGIMVDIDQQALFGYGLSPDDVTNAVSAQNIILPNGTAKIGKVEYNVELNSTPQVVDTLNNLPVKVVNGKIIYVRDVAQVRDGYLVQQSIVRTNGKRSVLQTILKNGAASTLDIINRVKAALPGIKATVPPDLNVRLLFDQSIFVKEAIKGVVIEAVIAGCLTASMILLFLGSLRSTFIVTITIPLAILCSILCLFVLHQTINIMTLGGLALAVGILVDDATVEIENIHRNLGQNKPIRKAIIDGASEIALPALVSTMSICIVFVPVFFITGPAKSLFTPLAMAVIFAMMFSYLISRTLIPTMTMYLLRDEVSLYQNQGSENQGGDAPKEPKVSQNGHGPSPDKPSKSGVGSAKKKKDPAASPIWKFHQKFEKRFEAFRTKYRDALGWCLGHPVAILVTFGILAGASMFLFPFLGRDFFPTVDAGQIRLHVRAPAGTRIEDTERLFAQVEASIHKVIPDDQINIVLDNIGLPVGGVNLAFSDSATIGSSDGDILIDLKGKHKPTAVYQQLLRDKLRTEFPEETFFFMPGDIVGQILNFGLPSPIDIQIAGSAKNAVHNEQIAEALVPQIEKIPGAVDVRQQQQMGVPVLHVNVDRSRAAEVGLTQRDIANGLLVSLAGSSQTAPNYFLDPTNGVEYAITVQTPQYRIDSLDTLLATPVLPSGSLSNPSAASASASASGSSASSPSSAPSGVPQLLSNIATVSRDTTQANSTDYNVQPTYDIYASVQGRDLAGVAADIDRITKNMKLPRGTQIHARGQVESMDESFLGLSVGLIFAIVLVYALMAINFQSWLDPLVVILALPGALSGILWMLFVTQTTLSVPAMMGMIMGMGVATANSILLVTFANEQREAGKSALDAALEAGATRIRPVLMTAIAMMIGMLPMALGLSEGGEQNAPLGRAVIGALMVATFVTLFVVPVLYSLLRKSESKSVFAIEEQEEAQYEREHGEPFDMSIPPEVIAALDRNAKDQPANGNGKPSDKNGQNPQRAADKKNAFSTSSTSPSRPAGEDSER